MSTSPVSPCKQNFLAAVLKANDALQLKSQVDKKLPKCEEGSLELVGALSVDLKARQDMEKAQKTLTDQKNQDLSDLNIGILPLADGANYEGANLSSSIASIIAADANFRSTNFNSANLRRTNVIRSNMENANFASADLSTIDSDSPTTITGSNLQKANFDKSDLRGTAFYDHESGPSNLSYANLTDAQIGVFNQGKNNQQPPQSTVEYLKERGVKVIPVRYSHEATTFHPKIETHFLNESSSNASQDGQKPARKKIFGVF